MNKKEKLIQINSTVTWFVKKMKVKLRENTHRPGWKKGDLGYLGERLREELDELDNTMASIPKKKEVVSECADIANFAMMIADVYKEQP